MIRRRVLTPALLLGLALTTWGCGGGEPSAGDLEEASPGTGDQAAVEMEGSPSPAEEPLEPSEEPARLGSIASETVHGWTGPGGQPFEVALRTASPRRLSHLNQWIGRRSFDLGLRVERPGLAQYPCASCHEPGNRLDVPPDRRDDAHRHVDPVHPEQIEGDCSACHATEVDRLRLPSGETVSLDHAYRLCSRCHHQELESWAAGVHGKRLVGWQGKRVVMGCGDCHDPHDPDLESRIPYPGPTIPRAAGGDR